MFATRRFVTSCLAFCMCAFWTGAALAQDELLVNVDAANPPFMYVSGAHAEGLYPDLIQAVFRQMKQPVTLGAKPWKRAIAELDLGMAGVGGIYKTEERVKKYDFSEPLFVERIVVYSNRDKPINYRTLADLYGKRVGVLLGWSYGDEFDAARKSGKIVADDVYSDVQNFDKLAQGRLDAVLAIEQVGVHLTQPPRNAGIEGSTVYLAENPTHLAFNKKQQRGTILRDFNRALAEIKKNGIYAEIVGKMAAGNK